MEDTKRITMQLEMQKERYEKLLENIEKAPDGSAMTGGTT